MRVLALPAPADDPEYVRSFHEVCRQDLVRLAGLNGPAVGRRLLELVLGSRVHEFAAAMAAFNLDIGERGAALASRATCTRRGAEIVADGTEHVPLSGPVLLIANHPGLMDTLAIYATVPRPDMRALARPQPLLDLLTELAPNLLMLPDEGAGRAGGLRQVLQSLRADGALLVFPAGHLEPEPTLLGRHGLRWPAPQEPLSAWSSGVGTLVKLATRQGVPLQVVPTSISGVLSASTWRWFGPLVRRRRTLRGREDLTALFQVAFPRLGRTKIHVCYGAPIEAASLAAAGQDADAITAHLRGVLLAQLQGRAC